MTPSSWPLKNPHVLLLPTIPGVTSPRTWHRFGNNFSSASAVSLLFLFLAVKVERPRSASNSSKIVLRANPRASPTPFNQCCPSVAVLVTAGQSVPLPENRQTNSVLHRRERESLCTLTQICELLYTTNATLRCHGFCKMSPFHWNLNSEN